MNTTFKKALLAGTAIVAIGVLAPSYARADEEIAGTIAVPTDLSAITAEQLTNTVDDQAAVDDAAFINAEGGAVTGTNIVIDSNATVGVFDGTAGGETIAFSGNLDLNSGVTLTLVGGGSEADGTGTDGAGISGFTLAGNLNAGTTSTRGGTVAILGAANEASGLHTFAFNGSTLLTAVSVTGGAGGAAEAGTAVAGSFGDAAADTFNVTTLSVTGGAGDAAGARAGAAATATVTGVTTIGGATTVVGGGDGAGGGAGGAALLTFNQAVTSSSTLTLTGGAGTGAGAAGDATALFRGNTTFTAVTLNTDEGVARLTLDVATDNTGDFTFTGAINGAAAGEGIILVSDDNATNADTVTFASAIGGTVAGTAVNTINVGDGTGNEGGHAIFNSTVRATTINVGAANTGDEASTGVFAGAITATDFKVTAGNAAAEDATATVRSNLTAAVTLTDSAATADATLTFDSATSGGDITVTGALIGGNAGDGIVNVGDGASATDVTFASAIGATAIEAFNVKNLSSATIDVAGAATVAVTSGAATDAGVDVDSGGTLNLDAADGTVAISDSVGDIDIDGSVNITGDNNVTFTGASDVFIDGSSTFDTELTAAKTTTVTATAGDLSLGLASDTTLALGNQLIVVTGDDVLVSDATDATVTVNIRYSSSFDADATTVIDATGVTGSDQIDTSGTSAALVFGIDADSFEFDDADTITAYDTDDLEDEAGTDTTWNALIAAGDVEIRDTGLVNLVGTGAGDDLTITVNFLDSVDVFEGGSSGVGAAQELLDLTAAQTTDELEDARGNLLNAADDEAAQEVGESLASTTDGSNVLASLAFGNRTAELNSTRLAAVRTGNETGMAAGSSGSGVGWWGQVFGTTGDQSSRDSFDGFEFDTIGVAGGVDTQNVADNATVGVALSYANTDVSSDNANSTDTDIDSFGIALYGDYDFDDRTYFAGQVGYAWGNNETQRFNVGGIAGLTADGDFDSNQFHVRGEVGRDYMAGGSMNGTKVTPKLLADYTHYNADDYTETGAGGANLTVDQESLNAFNVGVGVDASWMNKNSDGSYLEPGVHAAVRYDLVGDEVEATNTFAGAGSAFQTDGLEPGRATVDLGAGLTYHATTNWDLKAEYNFQGKEDFHSHSALLRAGYKF